MNVPSRHAFHEDGIDSVLSNQSRTLKNHSSIEVAHPRFGMAKALQLANPCGAGV